MIRLDTANHKIALGLFTSTTALYFTLFTVSVTVLLEEIDVSSFSYSFSNAREIQTALSAIHRLLFRRVSRCRISLKELESTTAALRRASTLAKMSGFGGFGGFGQNNNNNQQTSGFGSGFGQASNTTSGKS
jgi:hypothetical protein